MPTDDDAEVIAARKLELQEEHKQLPLFNAEEHMRSVHANLRPLPKGHWSRKKWHRDFMYSGWRRLIAKKDQEIADLRGRILHCMGKCSSDGAYARVVAQEMALAEEETARREAIAATGLYTGGVAPGEEPEVQGLVDDIEKPKAQPMSCDCGPMFEGKPITRFKCLRCGRTEKDFLDDQALIAADKAVGSPIGRTTPANKPCAGTCGLLIDPTRDQYFADVPGKGDLCLPCHHTWVTSGR